MNRLDSERIPLQFTHQRAGFDGACQLHDSAPVSHDEFERLSLRRKIDALLTVAVQNRWNKPLAAQATTGLSAGCLTG